jgi:hypothetical protein
MQSASDARSCSSRSFASNTILAILTQPSFYKASSGACACRYRATVREQGLVPPARNGEGPSQSRSCPRVRKQAGRIQRRPQSESDTYSQTSTQRHGAIGGQLRHWSEFAVPAPQPVAAFGARAYTGGDSEPLTPKGEKAYWRLGRCFGGPRWRGAGDEGLGGNAWASRVWKGGRRKYMLFRLCPTSK